MLVATLLSVNADAVIDQICEVQSQHFTDPHYPKASWAPVEGDAGGESGAAAAS